MKTRESQIREIAAATVLPCDNMIYLKRERVAREWNAAVLTPAIGPAPDFFYQPRVH